MVKLALVPARKSNEATPLNGNHRAAPSEGEAVRQILEQAGYPAKRSAKTQFECACPFHEEPGPVPKNKSPNFYVNRESGLYYCHSASCGEKGNLQTLERHFGLDVTKPEFQGREQQLQAFEAALTPERRQVLYDEGLNDVTIERFRIGWIDDFRSAPTSEHPRGRRIATNCYVFPYLEGRRAVAFRFYDPECNGPGGSKYWWEEGVSARPYNIGDAVGDKDGRVFLCHTPDTEILTERGWVAFPDLMDSDAVGQYDQETSEVSFVEPIERQVFDYSGPMISIKGRHADLLVTPEHRVLARGQKGVWRTKQAREWVGRKNLYFPVAGTLLSGERGNVAVARLLMAWVADGSRMKEGHQVCWNLKKGRKRERLHGLLDELGIEYREVEYPSTPGWHVTWVMRDQMSSLGIDTRAKLLPREALTWGMEARLALIEEARFWDGDGEGDHIRFFTGERLNADLLSELAALTGYGCVVRTDARPDRNDTWVVNLTPRKTRALADGVSVAPDDYTGKVYCVTVPTSYVVVRRNGKTMVSGNCEGEKKAMLLTQLGYAAVGVPGASNFKREWHEAFAHAKKILICFDSDNPEYHVYAKCSKCGEGECTGHNPGQEAAVRLVEQFGWRSSNIVLPLPEGQRKVDINEYFVRDGYTAPDFAELALGVRRTPYVVASLAEIEENPPDEAAFIVEHGILPRGGRLLISGAPKTGKSILAEHLALSVASGIPFLHRFGIDQVDGRRVLLLDRELSERALFDRLQEFIAYRPGYKVGRGNLLIDHEHQLRLDLKESYDPLSQIIEQNGAEVIILDTAYKFFQGDMESSSALMKVFDTLDRVIASTGVSVVVTHHQRKKVGGQKRRDADIGDPDNVAGSFLWTGWPNATVLLDFMDRRLNSPFNVVASFTAFRDAAPPEPLGLYRDKDSINYSAIQDYRPDQESSAPLENVRPSEETVGDLLIKLVPTVEDDFLHLAATKFGCRVDTIRPFVVSLIDQGHFTRTNGRPPVLKHVDRKEETYEEGLGMPAEDAQLRLVTEIDMEAN